MALSCRECQSYKADPTIRLFHRGRTALDQPMRVAAAARSMLACPASVKLVVAGVGDVLAGLDGPSELAVQDLDGTPTFSCAPHGAQSRALTFPRAATTPEELGELLRRALRAGLC